MLHMVASAFLGAGLAAAVERCSLRLGMRDVVGRVAGGSQAHQLGCVAHVHCNHMDIGRRLGQLPCYDLVTKPCVSCQHPIRHLERVTTD